MKIIFAKATPEGSKIFFETQDGTYEMSAATLEEILIEDGQMCPECHDTGEITTMETVWAGEPHQAPIGTRKCPCKGGEQDNG